MGAVFGSAEKGLESSDQGRSDGGFPLAVASGGFVVAEEVRRQRAKQPKPNPPSIDRKEKTGDEEGDSGEGESKPRELETPF